MCTQGEVRAIVADMRTRLEGLFPQQQIGDGPFAHAVELIGFVKMFHRMAGDFRVKSVRMNVCKHDPVRRLIQGKRPAFFRGRGS